MHIHFVGVKGTGVSALAQIAAKMKGVSITGSDVSEHFFTDAVLEKAGISPQPFSPQNVEGADLVVASAAYGKDHPELARALELGIPVLTYPQYLGRIMSQRRGVCITGTHGKTTTTAMIGLTLLNAGVDPTIVVGSDVPILGGNAYVGEGELFVAESCEYRRHFLNYNPELLVILNMELDHPDYFKDLDDVISAFQQLAEKVPPEGKIIICGDDANWQNINSEATLITFGLQKHNLFRASNLTFEAGTSIFEVMRGPTSLGVFHLGVTGNHNVLNALATIALADSLGVDLETIRLSLSQFTGTKRRFERLGEYKGALIMDDYAHHPTEVNTTLEGARLAYPEREIIAVFQPHTFTRTEKLFAQFSKCFSHADEVIVADIFASARERGKTGLINSKTLVDKIRENGVDAKYLGDFPNITHYLAEKLGPNHLVITMGAGDVYKIGLELVAKEQKQG